MNLKFSFFVSMIIVMTSMASHENPIVVQSILESRDGLTTTTFSNGMQHTSRCDGSSKTYFSNGCLAIKLCNGTVRVDYPNNLSVIQDDKQLEIFLSAGWSIRAKDDMHEIVFEYRGKQEKHLPEMQQKEYEQICSYKDAYEYEEAFLGKYLRGEFK